jgi:hypothetical protein
MDFPFLAGGPFCHEEREARRERAFDPDRCYADLGTFLLEEQVLARTYAERAADFLPSRGRDFE